MHNSTRSLIAPNNHDRRRCKFQHCAYLWVCLTVQFHKSHVQQLTLNSAVALGDVVTIAIGPGKKVYSIYKDLICLHSEDYRTVYNGRWKEAENGVELRDIGPEVSVFVHWLYVQQLPADRNAIIRIAGTDTGCDSNHIRLSEFLAIKAYVFGDRFMAPQLRCHTRNLYVNLKADDCCFYEHVIYAYANLLEEDPLLKYMVNLQCISWGPSADSVEEQTLRLQLPTLFSVQVMLRANELRETTVKKLRADFNPCAYHEHESEEERKVCPENKQVQAHEK